MQQPDAMAKQEMQPRYLWVTYLRVAARERPVGGTPREVTVPPNMLSSTMCPDCATADSRSAGSSYYQVSLTASRPEVPPFSLIRIHADGKVVHARCGQTILVGEAG